MTQLIVYTGFYWAVKVMENLLVVTALRCAFALNQHFKGASELGRNDGAQTADAHNSRPRRGSCSPGKARCVLLGISYHLRHASGNNATGEEGGKASPNLCKHPSRGCFELHEKMEVWRKRSVWVLNVQPASCVYSKVVCMLEFFHPLS